MANHKRFGLHFQYSRCETAHSCDVLENEWEQGTIPRHAGQNHISIHADEGQDGLLVVLVLNGKFSKRRLKDTLDRIYAAAGVKQ